MPRRNPAGPSRQTASLTVAIAASEYESDDQAFVDAISQDWAAAEEPSTE